MGTADRLTAAAGASVSDAPGFLPALEAGRTLTFRHPKHYWPVFLAASVAMTLFGLFLLALGGSTLPIFTWEAAVLLVPALAFIALGAFGFYQAVAGGLASLTMDALGVEFRYRNARSYRLRWHELAKAERRPEVPADDAGSGLETAAPAPPRGVADPLGPHEPHPHAVR